MKVTEQSVHPVVSLHALMSAGWPLKISEAGAAELIFGEDEIETSYIIHLRYLGYLEEGLGTISEGMLRWWLEKTVNSFGYSLSYTEHTHRWRVEDGPKTCNMVRIEEGKRDLFRRTRKNMLEAMLASCLALSETEEGKL